MKIDELKFRQIEWFDTIALRNEALWPNENATYCKVEGDEYAFHIGSYIQN